MAWERGYPSLIADATVYRPCVDFLGHYRMCWSAGSLHDYTKVKRILAITRVRNVLVGIVDSL